MFATRQNEMARHFIAQLRENTEERQERFD